ncbi:MAG: endonuclease/exonuclease/phosphatase family protein [Bacillota bacterium]|nr:endonuclease/exonuclease/phosphatase family protein [Bacillota bacterium]
MKIMTWNIRHGGSNRITKILETIQGHNPDLLVLTEYHTGTNIDTKLKDLGWGFQCDSKPGEKTNGILIVCKEPIVQSYISYGVNLPERWLEVTLPHRNLSVLGVYVPDARTDEKITRKKGAFLESVINFASERLNTQCMILGDFNTGLKIDGEGTPFARAEYLKQLSEIGWIDCWRSRYPVDREFTWYSHARNGKRNGFRLDYCFVTPSLNDRVNSVNYSHLERLEGVSDHSSLILDIQ